MDTAIPGICPFHECILDEESGGHCPECIADIDDDEVCRCPLGHLFKKTRSLL
jgi:hypothetical protein